MALLQNMKYTSTPFSLNIQDGVAFNNGNASSLFRYCYGYNNEFVIPDETLDASHMFAYASNLNSNVVFCEGIENTSYMFSGCSKFNYLLDLPNEMGNMDHMFEMCYAFNRPMHIPYYNTADYLFSSCGNLNANITFNSHIRDMNGTFSSCGNLNRNIKLPSSLVNAIDTFGWCSNLNQNIQIPSGVVNMQSTFNWCTNLDQAIAIPQGVQHMNATFHGCSSLSHYIDLPSSLVDAGGTFSGCGNYDFNVQIPSGVVNAGSMLSGTPINYNIQLPSGLTTATGMFSYCRNLNQNIHIPDSVTSASGMFQDCSNLNCHISIPLTTRAVSGIFMNCRNLYIPIVNIGSSVRDVANICARTKIRNIRLYGNNFSTMNYIFQAVENNYTLDLSGLTPVTTNLETGVTDWGDPIFTLTVPYDTKFYWWTTRSYEDLRRSFYNSHVCQIFGIEMSYYNWRLVQASDYNQWLSNEWYQEHVRASIFPSGFDEELNYGRCLYYDWQNTYYNSEIQDNYTPKYTCLVKFV